MKVLIICAIASLLLNSTFAGDKKIEKMDTAEIEKKILAAELKLESGGVGGSSEGRYFYNQISLKNIPFSQPDFTTITCKVVSVVDTNGKSVKTFDSESTIDIKSIFGPHIKIKTDDKVKNRQLGKGKLELTFTLPTEITHLSLKKTSTSATVNNIKYKIKDHKDVKFIVFLSKTENKVPFYLTFFNKEGKSKHSSTESFGSSGVNSKKIYTHCFGYENEIDKMELSFVSKTKTLTFVADFDYQTKKVTITAKK